ncbi:MAG: ABC transporter ATP-binding protein [Trueperaceae bacterium]
MQARESTPTAVAPTEAPIEGSAPPRLGGSIMRLLASLLSQATWQVAWVVLMTLGITLTSGIGLLMLVPLLQVAGLEVGEGSVGRLAQVAATGLGRLGLTPNVPIIIGLYLVVVSAGALLHRAHSIRTALLYQNYVMHLRRELYAAITHSRWVFFVGQKNSKFVHMLTQELERVGSAVSTLIGLIVKAILASIYLALAVVLSPLTTLLVLVCGGVLSLLLARKTQLGRAKGEAVSLAYEAMFGAISEHLDGMRISKSHGTEEHHLSRFHERTARSARSLTEVVRNQADVSFWLETGSALILAIIFYLALEVLTLPLAGILMLLYLFARLVPMVMGLQRQLHRLLDLLPAFDRVEAFMARLEAHSEPNVAIGEPLPLEREIRLDGVLFDYRSSPDTPVIEDLDLTIPAGRTTAIVGPSGAGKSTVADLLVGLVTPMKGRILIDGAELEGSRTLAWRRQIGYVNQDTFLFHTTIRENLLLVAPEASEDELQEAISAASADFVRGLPDGLDTMVGDRGVRLSGGERQRIALARAILRRPALLILDEATSALDAENESAIQRAIERMGGERTILVIAHRLASVRCADIIHVMEEGRIVESGSWDALLRQEDGRFRNLCIAQGLFEASEATTAHTLS